jgi:hypothetical protein
MCTGQLSVARGNSYKDYNVLVRGGARVALPDVGIRCVDSGVTEGMAKRYESSLTELNWDDYPDKAWQMPSLALVVYDGAYKGMVLCTAGPAIRYEIEENGLNELLDIGLTECPQGIWVWEGKAVFEYGDYFNPDESNIYLDGKFRSPTPKEWEAIHTNTNPWDDNDWR